jgi:hypothetical protein
MFRKILDGAVQGVEKLLGSTKFQIVYCILLVAVLFIALLVASPQQIPVVAYKLLLAPLGGLVGCCVWLALVPYSNPSRYLVKDWRSDPDADVDGEPDFAVACGYKGVFCTCLICAVLAFVLGMLAVGMGL